LRDDSDALAALAAGGDRGALDMLLDRHADRIHAVCRRVLADRDDALDATQEAMIAIARGIERFDGRAAFTTWMYRVATNAALDEARRQQRRPRPVDVTTEVPGARPAAAVGFDAQVDARLDVDAALRTLPDDFRAAVVLRDLCDLDYAEIAEVLQIPPGTVRSRISRGRALLHEALAGLAEHGAGIAEHGAGIAEHGAGIAEHGAGIAEHGAGERNPEPPAVRRSGDG
jgi:RNA polymerase sigma-70 factor, ECF subfamily